MSRLWESVTGVMWVQDIFIVSIYHREKLSKAEVVFPCPFDGHIVRYCSLM